MALLIIITPQLVLTTPALQFLPSISAQHKDQETTETPSPV